MRTVRKIRAAKAAVFALGLAPASYLLLRAVGGDLGANPVETITHATGDWALRFLLITLAITPLRKLTGWNRLIQFRRMLGLYAIFYACLHLSTWLIFDHFFDLRGMVEDVFERPYVTLGASAFLLLVPLAITSTNAWIRRLGKRWVTLHRLVYPAAILALAHFVWLVKADYSEPLVYAALLGVLLGYRLMPTDRHRRAPSETPGRRSTAAQTHA